MRPPSPTHAAPTHAEPAVAGPAGRRRAALAAVLAVTAPLLLAGCTIPGLSKTAETTTGATPAAASSGPAWQRVVQGNGPTSPAAAYPAATTPALTQPSAASAAPTASASASWLCDGRLRPGLMNGLSVTPGTGSAVVTWPNAGDPTVSEYRVAAESQRLVSGAQPAPVWKSVPPGTGCSQLTTTITGLDSDTYYVFWLDVVTTAPTGITRDTMIARSAPTRIG